MFRFAFSLASKVRPSKTSIRLSWSRNYSSHDLQLGLQDKLSQNPHVLQFHGPECLLPGVGAISLQQFENPSCDMDENGIRYLPVLREAMRCGVLNALEDGANAYNISRVIDPAIRTIQAHLKCGAQMISTSDQFTQVAIRAANGDTETGQLVAQAAEKIATGLYILSILENPIILIHENKFRSENVVLQAIELASDRRPLLIIAGSLTEEVTRLILSLNRNQTKLNVRVVKAPFAHYRNAIMQHLAILTGSQVLTRVSENDFKPSMLGSCKKAVVDTTRMVVLGGSGSQEEIEKSCEQLRSTGDNDVELESLKDRLHQLSYPAAVIKTQLDSSSERKIGIIRDAVVSAYESGILPGGGVALLHASKELDKFQTQNSDEKIAIQIFQNALKMPVCSMASTVGYDGSFVVKKLLDQDNPNLGYNPVRGEYVDVINSGIVDPFEFVMKELTKLIRNVLMDIKSCTRVVEGKMARNREANNN